MVTNSSILQADYHVRMFLFRQHYRIYGFKTKIPTLTQRLCIDQFSNVSLVFAQLLQNARPPLPSACPMAFSHLINRCWSSNPDKRPHFDEIVSILERYAEALEQDPDFFSSYKPSAGYTIFQCLPKYIACNRSSSSF